MTYSFHHLHLVCRDLEQMIDFFVEVIGAKLVKRRKFGNAEGAALDLQGVGINLRIAREGEETRDNLTQSTYGYDHIGLQVEDVQPVPGSACCSCQPQLPEPGGVRKSWPAQTIRHQGLYGRQHRLPLHVENAGRLYTQAP